MVVHHCRATKDFYYSVNGILFYHHHPHHCGYGVELFSHWNYHHHWNGHTHCYLLCIPNKIPVLWSKHSQKAEGVTYEHPISWCILHIYAYLIIIIITVITQFKDWYRKYEKLYNLIQIIIFSTMKPLNENWRKTTNTDQSPKYLSQED